MQDSVEGHCYLPLQRGVQGLGGGPREAPELLKLLQVVP